MKVQSAWAIKCRYVGDASLPVDTVNTMRLLEFKGTQAATFGGSWTSHMLIYEDGLRIIRDLYLPGYGDPKVEALRKYMEKRFDVKIKRVEDEVVWTKCLFALTDLGWKYHWDLQKYLYLWRAIP